MLSGPYSKEMIDSCHYFQGPSSPSNMQLRAVLLLSGYQIEISSTFNSDRWHASVKHHHTEDPGNMR